jgi:hypothetical protein
MAATSCRAQISDELNAFHFETAGNKAVPYRMQGGSSEFEASPIRRRRTAIRSSAKIRSASLQFWTTAGLKVDEPMPKPTYLHIHARISKVLAPELTEEEAAEAAEED